MKHYQYIIGIALAGVIILSCDKEKDFLRDNTAPTGVGYAPVSTNTLQDVTVIPAKNLGTSSSPSLYAAGASFQTELQFVSESPIKEINQYNKIGGDPRTKIGTWPYAKAFSNLKRVDTLLIPYTVPTVPSNTIIQLDYEIMNQNNLNVIRSVYIKVQ